MSDPLEERAASAARQEARGVRGLDRLVEIMRRLLGPDGCPWDREQTHRSLRPYLVEEAYEVLDAIDSADPLALREELGDLLLQVVFHAELGRRSGAFDIDDVAEGICDKLVRRHPHVFGEGTARTADDVAVEWARLKRSEGSGGPLAGVPRALPALRRAQAYGARLAKVGFDWPDASGPRAKVDEELSELDEALAGGDRVRVEAELGDLLLATTSVARHHGVDAEDALRAALDRFERRFAEVHERLRSSGRAPEACTIDELEAMWQAAKSLERDRAG